MAEESTQVTEQLPLEVSGGPAAVAPAAESAAPQVAAVEPTAEPEKKVELTSERPSLLDAFDAAEKAKQAEKTEAKAEEKSEAKPEEKTEEKQAEAKPAEEKPAEPEEKKPEDVKPVELAPVEYKYTLPETIKLDDAHKVELHGALDDFRKNPAEGVQKLIDLHNKTMQEYDAQVVQRQHEAFNQMRDDWNKQVMADPELGGAGHQTAMQAIARMRDLAVPEKDRPAFEQFLRITGAGDHPAFLKAMHNFARYFDEAAQPPPNARPAPNNGKRPMSRLRDAYDRSTGPERQ